MIGSNRTNPLRDAQDRPIRIPTADISPLSQQILAAFRQVHRRDRWRNVERRPEWLRAEQPLTIEGIAAGAGE